MPPDVPHGGLIGLVESDRTAMMEAGAAKYALDVGESFVDSGERPRGLGLET
jgi:hypothetical protein